MDHADALFIVWILAVTAGILAIFMGVMLLRGMFSGPP
jgi:hypothetical protein